MAGNSFRTPGECVDLLTHVTDHVAVARDAMRVARRAVSELAAAGVSERRIAATTGLSRTTVRRWLGKVSQ